MGTPSPEGVAKLDGNDAHLFGLATASHRGPGLTTERAAGPEGEDGEELRERRGQAGDPHPGGGMYQHLPREGSPGMGERSQEMPKWVQWHTPGPSPLSLCRCLDVGLVGHPRPWQDPPGPGQADPQKCHPEIQSRSHSWHGQDTQAKSQALGFPHPRGLCSWGSLTSSPPTCFSPPCPEPVGMSGTRHPRVTVLLSTAGQRHLFKVTGGA